MYSIGEFPLTFFTFGSFALLIAFALLFLVPEVNVETEIKRSEEHPEDDNKVLNLREIFKVFKFKIFRIRDQRN